MKMLHEQSLSNREIEIMSFVTAGLSAKQISQKIHCCQRTVETHMVSIKYKLKAKNIAHAAAIYIEKFKK